MTENTKEPQTVAQERWSGPFNPPPQLPTRAGAPSLSHAPASAVGVSAKSRGQGHPHPTLARTGRGRYYHVRITERPARRMAFFAVIRPPHEVIR